MKTSPEIAERIEHFHRYDAQSNMTANASGRRGGFLSAPRMPNIRSEHCVTTSLFQRLRIGEHMEANQEILTIKEVAQLLRCSKAHVANALNGRVPGIPRLTQVSVGRRKLIRKEWLNQWLEANRHR